PQPGHAGLGLLGRWPAVVGERADDGAGHLAAALGLVLGPGAAAGGGLVGLLAALAGELGLQRHGAAHAAGGAVEGQPELLGRGLVLPHVSSVSDAPEAGRRRGAGELATIAVSK